MDDVPRSHIYRPRYAPLAKWQSIGVTYRHSQVRFLEGVPDKVARVPGIQYITGVHHRETGHETVDPDRMRDHLDCVQHDQLESASWRELVQ